MFMVNVLFVCLGNICRSPMAEGVFLQLVKEAGLEGKVTADSAGTASFHIGSRPDFRTLKVCTNNNIELVHMARAFKVDDYAHFDYIIPMDLTNKKNVLALTHPASKAHVICFGEFTEPFQAIEIPDPYYGGMDGFRLIYKMLQEHCNLLLQHIIDNHELK